MMEKTFTLHNMMPLGKYRDQKSVMWVIMFDTAYMTWVLENVEWFLLDNIAYALYEKYQAET